MAFTTIGCNQLLGVGAITHEPDAAPAPIDDAPVDAALGPICGEIMSTCRAAQASEIGSLLAPAIVDACVATAAGAGEDACTQSRAACDRECAPPSPAMTTASLYHCWQEAGGKHRMCFGMSYVPGATSAHAYASWTVYQAGDKPAASDVYEIFGAHPGLLELYNFQGAAGECYRVDQRADAIFVTTGVRAQVSCDQMDATQLGAITTRLDLVAP